MKKQDVKNYLSEAYNNLNWDNGEINLYDDGMYGIRTRGSKGDYEDEIIYTLSLTPEYWMDSEITGNEETFVDNMYDEVYPWILECLED